MSNPVFESVVKNSQESLTMQHLDGWLLYDYRGMNPLLWEVLGHVSNVTRPCWLWIPSDGKPRLLVSYVDRGRFEDLAMATTIFVSRADMIKELANLIGCAQHIAMDYSPLGELPKVSRVDAGTLELVRSLGVQISSSGDTIQYATQRWSKPQLRSHMAAADRLSIIVQQAFRYIGQNLSSAPTEHSVAQYIRQSLLENGMEVTDGPVVAVNEHSSDPHYEPRPDSSVVIKPGDWILIDLWSRLNGQDNIFADITWTAYVGKTIPANHQQVFRAVVEARDAAVNALKESFCIGEKTSGWEIDKVARERISEAGYAKYFNHRLGHSLGTEVHGRAVNLDGWETYDVRQIIPGIGITIEPGVYLPEFGVRSEINLYVTESGPQITTEVQNSIVLI